MIKSCLRTAALCLGLAWGVGITLFAGPPGSGTAVRPQIQAVSILLEDGRTYSLSTTEVQDAKGGALFWGDWAVANLLLPFSVYHRHDACTPESVLRLWFTPGPSGQLPAFMVLTTNGPVYPLEPGGPAHSFTGFGWAYRPKIQSIDVMYADGRIVPLSHLTLTDSKSGVMVWNDFAVSNILMPFYVSGRSLVTTPGDVMRLWYSSAPALFRSNAVGEVEEDELPGFIVKPRCIPHYPGPAE